MLDAKPGQVFVDCTIGFAGHAVELLHRVGPGGLLIGIDWDADNLPKARARLQAVGYPFRLIHGNFASLETVLAQLDIVHVDGILADLGMSSMQVDDAERGFSYMRDGPLDMRMDRSHGQTAAQLLGRISEMDLRHALAELGDHANGAALAAAICEARAREKFIRTRQLADFVLRFFGKTSWRLRQEKRRWQTHPAAQLFQTLRILVNRELGNLGNLLRVAPSCLKPRACVAIIGFHSGEDRLIKRAFREDAAKGIYAEMSQEPMSADFAEKSSNPRSRSAKMRWARRAV